MIMLDDDAQRYLECRRQESALLDGDALTPELLRAEERRLRYRYGHGPQMTAEVLIAAKDEVPRHFILDPCEDPVGVLVYFHGGGWVMGEPEDYLAVCRALAAESGWRVVVADYRKAPEHPFPAAFDDALTLVRKFIVNHASEDSDPVLPVGVGGDSAGGNLAAAVASHLAVSDPAALAVQVLVTPVLDTDLNTSSYRDPERQLTLTREGMAWFLAQYVTAEFRTDPRVAPLHAPGIAALPPTIFVAVHSDVLFSEGRTYLAQLRRADVEVLYHEYSGQMHGFFQLYNVMKASKNAIAWIAAALQQFGNSPTSGRKHILSERES